MVESRSPCWMAFKYRQKIASDHLDPIRQTAVTDQLTGGLSDDLIQADHKIRHLHAALDHVLNHILRIVKALLVPDDPQVKRILSVWTADTKPLLKPVPAGLIEAVARHQDSHKTFSIFQEL